MKRRKKRNAVSISELRRQLFQIMRDIYRKGREEGVETTVAAIAKKLKAKK